MNLSWINTSLWDIKKGRCSRENPLKGSIRITNGVINLVLYNKDDDMPEGFYKGVTNWNTKGNTGRTFINDGVRDKAVLVEEAEKYISTGKYKYGRLASPKRGKVSVYNEKDHIRIFVDKDEEDYYLNKGYKRGDPSWMPVVNKGRIYVNNGTSNKMIYPEDLPEYESMGYSKGILRRPKGYRLLSSTTIM